MPSNQVFVLASHTLDSTHTGVIPIQPEVLSVKLRFPEGMQCLEGIIFGYVRLNPGTLICAIIVFRDGVLLIKVSVSLLDNVFRDMPLCLFVV